MAIYELSGVAPTIDPSAYIAESATVIGNASIAINATVSSGVVIRGYCERPGLRRIGFGEYAGTVLAARPAP